MYYLVNIADIRAAELPQNGIAVECIEPSSCRELFSVRESPRRRISLVLNQCPLLQSLENYIQASYHYRIC